MRKKSYLCTSKKIVEGNPSRNCPITYKNFCSEKMEYISATIITYNEASRISECLDSLRIGQLVDEIVVVDSGSTDDTAEICRRAGCRVVVRQFDGYGIQRQFASSLTSNNYILAIDADECLSDELVESLMQIKQKGFEHRVYAMPIKEYILGQKVHTNASQNSPIRLFNKRYAQWNLDDVGERVTFPNSLQPQVLKGHLMHRPARSEKELYDKELRKAIISARIHNNGKKSVSVLTPQIKAIKTFCRQYIGSKAFMDGKTGYLIAVTKARAVKNAYRLLRRGSN